MSLFVLRSTFDVRRSFFLYMSGINSMFVRRSTLSIFFIYIRYIKCSSFVRHSTFDFHFSTHVRYKPNVRRSTFDVQFSSCVYDRTIECSTFDAQFFLHMCQKVRPSTHIQYFYHTCIQKEFLNDERRTFAVSIVHVYKKRKVERRMSNFCWFYRTCIQKKESRRSKVEGRTII